MQHFHLKSTPEVLLYVPKCFSKKNKCIYPEAATSLGCCSGIVEFEEAPLSARVEFCFKTAKRVQKYIVHDFLAHKSEKVCYKYICSSSFLL